MHLFFGWIKISIVNSSCPNFKRHIAYCLHVVLYKKYYAYNCQYYSHKHSIFFWIFLFLFGSAKPASVQQNTSIHLYFVFMHLHILVILHWELQIFRRRKNLKTNWDCSFCHGNAYNFISVQLDSGQFQENSQEYLR